MKRQNFDGLYDKNPADRVIDYNDPRSILEAQEEEAESMAQSQVKQPATQPRNDAAIAAALGRIFAWMIDAKHVSAIGQRAMVAAYVLRPDLVDGATLDKIAKAAGQGRSAVHKLKKDFQEMFGVSCKNDKPKSAIKKYKEAWRRSPAHRPKTKTNLPT